MNTFENEKYVIEIRIILNLKVENGNQFFIKIKDKDTQETDFFQTNDYFDYKAILLKLDFDLMDRTTLINKAIYDWDIFKSSREEIRIWSGGRAIITDCGIETYTNKEWNQFSSTTKQQLWDRYCRKCSQCKLILQT